MKFNISIPKLFTINKSKIDKMSQSKLTKISDSYKTIKLNIPINENNLKLESFNLIEDNTHLMIAEVLLNQKINYKYDILKDYSFYILYNNEKIGLIYNNFQLDDETVIVENFKISLIEQDIIEQLYLKTLFNS